LRPNDYFADLTFAFHEAFANFKEWRVMLRCRSGDNQLGRKVVGEEAVTSCDVASTGKYSFV